MSVFFFQLFCTFFFYTFLHLIHSSELVMRKKARPSCGQVVSSTFQAHIKKLVKNIFCIQKLK
jgi:hypothetical protein